jgi:hypothetical protein
MNWPRLPTATNDIRLVPAEPSVFITFERFGERPPRDETEATTGVWLRLHNNSRWPIVIYTNCTKGTIPTTSLAPCYVGPVGVLPDSAAVDFGYIRYNDPHGWRLTAADLRTSQFHGPYELVDWMGCEEWLLPGKTVLFSVANESLEWGTGRSISVDFDFPWSDPCPDYSNYLPTRSGTRIDVTMHSSQVPWSNMDAGPQAWMQK